ncbi:hypothetical protein HMPREF9220_1361 [Dialister micraerophilus UPII 345-E]|uniref:Uncharacterized protein n=1 Tax=Dialister micraerophilus UPII 345-E TaxID=910314 RepID=E4L768_9FIRM|nr:hypothetical protein HMPREF9220_1361 [Dialister micraerophilus UPII 345-E]
MFYLLLLLCVFWAVLIDLFYFMLFLSKSYVSWQSVGLVLKN